MQHGFSITRAPHRADSTVNDAAGRATEPHGGYVVTATWEEGTFKAATLMIGIFITEEDAREYVAIEEAHGACARHSITKLALPRTSPVHPVGRW